jgi:hypothetical protein
MPDTLAEIKPESDMVSAPTFNEQWRKICQVIEGPRSAVQSMINSHYLGKWPGVVRCVLVMVAKGEPVGMCIYAEPPMQSNVRYGGKGFELARLWISDTVPRNAETWLIAQSVRFVKRKWPALKYLVSYADPSAGHRGTIYKAANWSFDGRTDAGRKTPRCDYVDERGKKYSRASHVPAGIVIKRVPRVSKFRFVYWLKPAHKENKESGFTSANTRSTKAG